MHGASWWQTLWRIMVALAWPSFAVGWVLTFFGIMRELSASVLLYSVGSEVLSVVHAADVEKRAGRAGQRDRPDDDAAGVLFPLGSAPAHQELHQYLLDWIYRVRTRSRKCLACLRRLRRGRQHRSAVEAGEFVTLLGPSGCGKTTTLRMVAGLEQSTGGRISIGERVVNDPADDIHLPPDRRRLGMVFQSYAIWPHMTGVRQRGLSAASAPPAAKPRSASASRER